MNGNIDVLRWRISCALSYRLRLVANRRFAAHCRPTSIILMLTELCNARCTHCDIWKNKGKEDVPSLEDWQRVLTGLRQWLGPAHVALSGGEALLRRDAHEILRHGSRLGLLMELLSHGYWPDGKRLEEVAEANPWRVTLSVDGIGEVHNEIRGKADFWDRTSASLDTLVRLRRERGLHYIIQLKTVLMRQNLDSAPDVARYAAERGVEVFYQSIEQNYNTEQDALWYRTSPNWPTDTGKAERVVDELIALQNRGLPIKNSPAQLHAMKEYFRDPDGLRLAIQSHTAHETRSQCSAMTGLQIQANGDVATCSQAARFGNIKREGIRELWVKRPRYWVTGCCREPAGNVACQSAESLRVLGS
jgi:MoaA/NifB/PqqE/SkfB family radical SAM enzyme